MRLLRFIELFIWAARFTFIAHRRAVLWTPSQSAEWSLPGRLSFHVQIHMCKLRWLMEVHPLPVFCEEYSAARSKMGNANETSCLPNDLEALARQVRKLHSCLDNPPSQPVHKLRVDCGIAIERPCDLAWLRLASHSWTYVLVTLQNPPSSSRLLWNQSCPHHH